MLNSMESGVSVVFEKAQHVVAPDVIQLAGLHGLDRQLVPSAGNHRVQAQNFTRLRDSDHQGLASREVAESLVRPWQRIKIPHGLCPSTRTTACSGKTAACFILLNASMDSWERSQKKLRETQMAIKTDFNASSIRTHSLALLHLPQKHLCAGFSGKTIDQP